MVKWPRQRTREHAMALAACPHWAAIAKAACMWACCDVGCLPMLGCHGPGSLHAGSNNKWYKHVLQNERIYMHIYECTSTYTHVHVFVYIWIYIYMYVPTLCFCRKYIYHVRVYKIPCFQEYLYICKYIYIYPCVCICVHTNIRMCIYLFFVKNTYTMFVSYQHTRFEPIYIYILTWNCRHISSNFD